ncbi:MAG: SUMF1/EgtB/PvdO family nonheme iron enzyme [Deltaproteobacteria bacterium]|nr:SUMF1/EgtB/PvdO family nonheme iron enzyme [Deltaproteobacteria bacterium]
MSALAILDAARERTLAVYGELPDEVLGAWPDPEFSPLCWHLGHIAFTEAHWLLAKVGGDGALSVPHARRYAQDGCAKAERNAGYDRGELFDYLERVRAVVRERYATLDPDHPLMRDDYLARFLANHEHQHRETMAYVLGCHRERAGGAPDDAAPLVDDGAPSRLELEGGAVTIGTDDPHAYDNERSAHEVTLAPFALDAHPVTVAAWKRFIDAGGYAREALWSPEGWAWRRTNDVRAPKGWRTAGESFVRVRLDGRWSLDGREPVVGVSAHEAEAYARFVGGRLPTEAELEHAARATGAAPRIAGLTAHGPMPVVPGEPDLLGNVWEWTASTFAPYPGFSPHPYRGYSEPYFDGVHRVLRGGSFATDPAIARPTFRNWYVPETRQIFAGLRVAYG